MSEIVPRKTLVKQGLQSVFGIAAGVTLLILSNLTGVVGWIVGGAITIIGLGVSTSKEDRFAGLVVAGAGVLTLVSQIPGISGLGSILMTIGGIGLIGAGIFSLFNFFKNLKSRS